MLKTPPPRLEVARRTLLGSRALLLLPDAAASWLLLQVGGSPAQGRAWQRAGTAGVSCASRSGQPASLFPVHQDRIKASATTFRNKKTTLWNQSRWVCWHPWGGVSSFPVCRTEQVSPGCLLWGWLVLPHEEGLPEDGQPRGKQDHRRQRRHWPAAGPLQLCSCPSASASPSQSHVICSQVTRGAEDTVH